MNSSCRGPAKNEIRITLVTISFLQKMAGSPWSGIKSGNDFFFPGQGKSGNFILRQENLDKVDEKKIQKRVDS